MSKILILMGGPRKLGNTARLAAELARGARDAGSAVTGIFLRDKTFGDCPGCCFCKSSAGNCVQKDDMAEVYASMLENDVIVLASPVYFYTWTSLMKRALDRTFAIEALMKNKTFYLVATGAATDESYQKTMFDSFEFYVACFEGCKAAGHLIACDTREPET